MSPEKKKPNTSGSSINLRSLEYSPAVNPLLEPSEVQLRKRYVRTSGARALMDPETREIQAIAAVHTIEYRDDAGFVKVFAEGVRASYDLTKTAHRVFQAVLAVYQQTPMTGGFAEAVELFWFNDGLNGHSMDMSEKTFQRGLKELLAKKFLAPRNPSSFWVNSSLFFKGDRVAFIREYRRARTLDLIEPEAPRREALQQDLLG